eukprot:11196602-Lingulodinium_polyedra.AAC.1
MRERAFCEPPREHTVDSTASLRNMFTNPAQRCDRIGRSPPLRLANRTRAHSTRAPENWRAHGAQTCDSRAAAAAD